jgi:Fic family protein
MDLKKIKYKYPNANMSELVELLKTSVFKPLPIKDFEGKIVVYSDNLLQIQRTSVKLLLTPQKHDYFFGLDAMEEEISSTLTIEDIDFSRESVRKILNGKAPSDEKENRIYGMKKGLEFISDPEKDVTERNIHELYELAIGQYLTEECRLKTGSYYRHDDVYIVGHSVEHTGLPHEKLEKYMNNLVSFINEDKSADDLLKAAIIHFYLAYLHPYFDGNGRMARLLHLWYLTRQGYSSTLFVPFSSFIERSRQSYYKAFTLIENNLKISGILDVTPFIAYFIKNVYNKLENVLPLPKTTDDFENALAVGKITAKEKDLWNFVLSAYGTKEFSTKQLERDFANAAYATIRGFVLKFEELGLLTGQSYGNRVKYSIK